MPAMRLQDAAGDPLCVILAFLKPRDKHALRASCRSLYTLSPARGTRLRIAVQNWSVCRRRFTRREGASAAAQFWGLRASCVELCTGLYTKAGLRAALGACLRLSRAGASPRTVCVRFVFEDPKVVNFAAEAVNAVARCGVWSEAELELRCCDTGCLLDVGLLCPDALHRLVWCDLALRAATVASPPELPVLRYLKFVSAGGWSRGPGSFPALEVLDASHSSGQNLACFFKSADHRNAPKVIVVSTPACFCEGWYITPSEIPEQFRGCRLDGATVRCSTDLTQQLLAADYCRVFVSDDSARWLIDAVPPMTATQTLEIDAPLSVDDWQVCRDAAAAVLRAATGLCNLHLSNYQFVDEVVFGAIPQTVRHIDLSRVPCLAEHLSAAGKGRLDWLLRHLPGPVTVVARDHVLPATRRVFVRSTVPWLLTGLNDRGPPPGLECYGVRIGACSYTARATGPTAASTAPWTQKVREVHLGCTLGPLFVETAELLATMFPRVKRLVAVESYAETNRLNDTELAAVGRLMVALGPRLRFAEGQAFRRLRNDAEIRRACPWVAIAYA